MADSPDSTVPRLPIPSVVIIAPAPEMLDIWLEVLQSLDEVPSIQMAELKDAATAVARWRPLALLVEQDLLEFDSREFDELARDVGAEIIAVDARAGKTMISALVVPKLNAALERWKARDPSLQ
jgi:hypothetical protein